MLPIETQLPQTAAHRDHVADAEYLQWRAPAPPPTHGELRTARPFFTCTYCGSMHPTELVEALNAGATIREADRKFGWPHKFYVEGAPNRFAGHTEVRSYSTGPHGLVRPGEPSPAPDVTDAKFYTVHLLDASPDERAVIERAMGLRFDFTPSGMVRWRMYEAAA